MLFVQFVLTLQIGKYTITQKSLNKREMREDIETV